LQKPLSVKEVKLLEELLHINKELGGMNQQLSQFQNALNELNQINEDAKNKVINHIMIPSLGGLMLKVNPSGKRFRKISEEKKRQFNNSILGIKGQLSHRGDIFNETSMKLCNSLLFHLKEDGVDLNTKHFARHFKEEDK